MNLKQGDLVQVIEPTALPKHLQNQIKIITGIVKSKNNTHSIAVEFPFQDAYFHTCEGQTKEKYGWWIDIGSLKLAHPPLTKEERVLNKIKYLDDKYKQHIQSKQKTNKDTSREAFF